MRGCHRLTDLVAERRGQLSHHAHPVQVREIGLQLTQSLALQLGALAIFDVRQGPVPFQDLALLIAQRDSPHEKPAVFARRAAMPRLILKWLADGDRVTPLRYMLTVVVRMDCGLPTGPRSLLHRLS